MSRLSLSFDCGTAVVLVPMISRIEFYRRNINITVSFVYSAYGSSSS